MTRTTLDIDAPILKEVKALQKKQGQSMGKIVSQLLAEALSRHKGRVAGTRLKWTSRPMQALVDISDKDALNALLDRDKQWPTR